MKTKKIESLDDLVFSSRNKSYGAFFLRKTYKKHLFFALTIAVSLFVVTAVVSMKNSLSHRIENFLPKVEIFGNMVEPPEKKDDPIKPLELPPDENIEKKLGNYAPIPTYNNSEIDTVESTTVSVNPVNPNYHFTDTTTFVETKKPDIIDPPDESTPLLIVTEPPEYPGGDAERLLYLQKNIIYPDLAKQTNIQGTFYLSFVINRNGSISDITIERGIGGGCDEEAYRVVKMMPSWSPGKQTGKAVRVKCIMQVKFTLLN
ncbi:MAG: TonB family protein [Bacteroidota bacterium]